MVATVVGTVFGHDIFPLAIKLHGGEHQQLLCQRLSDWISSF
jgi:hypothetical protein